VLPKGGKAREKRKERKVEGSRGKAEEGGGPRKKRSTYLSVKRGRKE
jgi:hypothetical protein